MDAEVQADSAAQRRRGPLSSTGLVGNLFTVGSFATLVKLIGAVKVAVTARLFGANSELDAYLIAFLLPSFFAEVFSGSVRSALVPTLVRAQSNHDLEEARALCRTCSRRPLLSCAL